MLFHAKVETLPFFLIIDVNGYIIELLILAFNEFSFWPTPCFHV